MAASSIEKEIALLKKMKPKWGDPPTAYVPVVRSGVWMDGNVRSHYIHQGENRPRCDIDPCIVLRNCQARERCSACMHRGAPRD